MNTKYLPLLLAPIISCGCPSKDGPGPNTGAGAPVPTVTVTSTGGTMPTATVPEPEPEPKPTINWRDATEEEVLTLATEGACLVVRFRSSDNEVQKVMDLILEDEVVVQVVNERFVAFIWNGSDEIRTEFFGVPLDESSLLVVPKHHSNYLLFSAFDGDGKIKAPFDVVSTELANGLASDIFANCTTQ